MLKTEKMLKEIFSLKWSIRAFKIYRRTNLRNIIYIYALLKFINEMIFIR